jgi:hypothetical protein
VPSVADDVIRRILNSQASAETIALALENRQNFQRHASRSLHEIIQRGGSPAGMAAVLLGDARSVEGVLGGVDLPAQRSLLACARLIRHPLELNKVAELMSSGDQELALAAERYLESEDSPLARSLVRARHPGECIIQGARLAMPFKTEFEEWEDGLHGEITRADGADEIFALLRASDNQPTSHRILRIRNGQATLHVESPKPMTVPLTREQQATFLAFISENSIDDLAPLDILVPTGPTTSTCI